MELRSSAFPTGAGLSSRPHDTELVLCKVHGRLSRRGIDLILVLTPLRIVDAVDPLLGLNH